MADNKKLTIAGEAFEVTTPYAPGHVINEAEARSLNQTRAENIGNNCREEVKKALGEGKSVAEIQAVITEYDARYNFSMGGSTREPVDPLEREARSLARAAISEALRADGRKIKDIDKDKLEEAITNLASTEDILRAAKKRLAEKKKTSAVSLSDLGLGGDAPQPTV